MSFVAKIIILTIVIVVVALLAYYIFKPNKKIRSYNDLFEDVLEGREDVLTWSKYLPLVIGEDRLREAELLAERLPEGKILVAKEINRVWVGNNLFFIKDENVYLRERAEKLSKALRVEYARALKTPGTGFVFPSYVTDCEVKYMNPIQRLKYNGWRNGISEELNKKLAVNRIAINHLIRGKYLKDTEKYLKENNLKREHVLPQAVKIFLSRAENSRRAADIAKSVSVRSMLSAFNKREHAQIEEIANGLQQKRAEKHAVKELARQIANEDTRAELARIEEVQFGYYNAQEPVNPIEFALYGGNQLGEGGLRNANVANMFLAGLKEDLPEETIAERVERVRKEDNMKNSTFTQSVHDATLSSTINGAVSRKLLECSDDSSSSVYKLASDFSRLYPEKAKAYQTIFIQDKDRDYMKAFADVVYDDRNDSVRGNLLEALSYEIDNIAPFCLEGRKNKTWSLLSGIDKSGSGENIASRTEIIDSLLNEFGRITNEVGLTSNDMIKTVTEKSKEFKSLYPGLLNEIEKKLDETKSVIRELYDDEVNLYGSTQEGLNTWSNQIGSGVSTGIDFGKEPSPIIQVDVLPQEATLADPSDLRIDPGFQATSLDGGTGHSFEAPETIIPLLSTENFSVDSMPSAPPPIAALTPVDLSSVTPVTPGAVYDVTTTQEDPNNT